MFTDNLENPTTPHKRKTVLPCGVLESLIEDFADGQRHRVGRIEIIPNMPQAPPEVETNG
jgi:hypothetical protein